MRATLIELSTEMGLNLSEKQLDQFETYARLLVEWNEKMNLTGITEPEEIARKHFIDSLVGWETLRKAIDKKKEKTDDPVRLIDVGTGAGFPGIPLKILFPEIHLTLLDSLQKRVGFLQAVGEAIGLEDTDYVHGRAEDTAQDPDFRETYDFAVARAVANLPVLMEYCSGYVKNGGYFMAYKGPTITEELENAKKAMRVLKMEKKALIKADILGEDYQHYVAVFKKTGALGLQYPRKQSKIKAMPL